MRHYLSEISNWRYALLVMLTGYAVGLTGWLVRHGPLLPGYVLRNELDQALRREMTLGLVMAMLAALAIWLLSGILVTRTRPNGLAGWLNGTATTGIALALLPLLPVLAIQGIEKDAPLLTLALIVAASIIAAVAARSALALKNSACKEKVLHRTQTQTLSPAPEILPQARSRPDPGLIVVVGFALAYTIFMSLLTISRHNSFGTHAYDLGIHAQSIYSIVHHGYPATTLYGSQPVNQFGDHFTPLFYLIAPLYAAWSDARLLLVLQSTLLALGVVPIYLLARRQLRSVGLASIVALSYLLYPALHGINNFDFHEIALAVPLLLFALYFLNRDRFGAFVLFLILASFAKEEIPLTGVAIGLYILWEKRQPRRGLLVTLASLSYFLIVTRVVMPALGGGPDIGRFAGLTPAGWNGFAGVILTVFTNPFFTFSYALLDADKAFYLAQLLVPLAGLPFLAGVSHWLVILPGLATSLLSSYRPQYLLETHYSAILVPTLFFLAILGLARLQRHRRTWGVIAGAGLLAASLLMNYQYGWLWGKLYTGLPQMTEHQRAIARLVRDIPPEAAVSTLSDFIPHLANRDQVYMFPEVADADFILFDADPRANYFPVVTRDPRGDSIARIFPSIHDGTFGLVREQDGVLLLRRGHDTAQNAVALRTLGSMVFDAATLPGAASAENRPDAATRSGQARVSPARTSSEDEEPIRAVFGPYATVIPGRYSVEYRLKITGPLTHGPVVRIDVFSYAGGGLLGQRDVAAAEFQTDGYTTFALEFQTGQLLPDVEFRVAHSPIVTLSVDTIVVLYRDPA